MDGVFVFFRGYIDESFDPRLSKIFTLSCLLSTGKIWSDFARAWKLMLGSWNRRLKRQGRPTISRYHASYCSNLKGEFAGWSKDEQRELFSDILKIFERHQVDTVALSLNLDDLDKYFPEARREAKPDFTTFMYGMMMKFLLNSIASPEYTKNPGSRIALIHDRCAYSNAMFEAFSQMKVDPGARYSDRLATFAASDWRSCIPLQPADLVAYENFKDAMRRISPRERRPSLEMLIDLDAFSGKAQIMDKNAILEFRKGMMETALSLPAPHLIELPTAVRGI